MTRKYLQLSGRLGNQLFQWSYAHNLAETFGEKIFLFTDKYHAPIKNDEEIKYFTDCTHVGYQGQVDNLGRELKALDWLNTKNRKFSELLSKKLLWERTIDAYTAPKFPIGLWKFSGFYQDYQQVLTVDDIIYSEIRNITDIFFMRLKEKNHLPNEFQFMHIRRGDLMTNSEVYGVLDLSWYLSNRNSDLPLLVSTDDMVSSEGLIQALQPIVIDDVRNIIYNNIGVISVRGISITNVSGVVASRQYSSVRYDVNTNLLNNSILVPPPGGMFEIRFPNSDITGRVI